MNLPILTLAAAAFAMITTEFNIVGVLPLIARDMNVPVSQVGLLVTAFAFTVALLGPFLTIAMASVERRSLFTWILAVSALGNLIAAAAPSYPVLAAGRMLAALALPVFWSMASATAADIAGPQQAGRAIATVFSGISVASVAGTPITTLLASVWGWRAAFLAAAALCAAMAMLIWILFPRTAPAPTNEAPRQSPLSLLRQPVFIGHLFLSLLVMTSMFTAYTYLADMLTRLGGFTDMISGWALMGFGVAGIAGNALAGRTLDAGPMRSSLLSVLFAGAVMAVFVPALGNVITISVAIALWGAAHAASFVANHVRVIKAATEEQKNLAASLNVSVFNTGIGLGAIVGGEVIDRAGLSMVGPVASVLCAFALFTGLLIVRSAKKPKQPDIPEYGLIK